MAYKCRNCGYDEPCAVCVECFREGDHKGHDYLLIQVAGGCCDCGDPLAWRPEGNCRRHVGNSESDPSEFLTPCQRVTARATMRAVVRVLGELLLRVARLRARLTPVAAPGPLLHLIPHSTEPPSEEEAQAIVSQVGQLPLQCELLLHWLQHAVEYFGDPMRRLLCLAVDDLPAMSGPTSDQEGSPAPAPEPTVDKLIMQLLLMDHLLSPALQNELRKWYFTLIGDTEYKKLFSIYYVKAYPHLMDVYIEEKTKVPKSKYETLLTMSTQFFHPHLIPHLVHNAGLLDMLLDQAYQVLQHAFAESPAPSAPLPALSGRSKEIDADSAVLRKRLFWILFHDLRAVTAVPAVVQPLVLSSPASLNRLLRLWDLFQDMDPVPRRRMRSHVPLESNTWIHSFTLEIEAIEAVTEQVVDGVEVMTDVDLARPDVWAHACVSFLHCLETILTGFSLRYRLSPDGQLSLEASPAATQDGEAAEGEAEEAGGGRGERAGLPAGTGQLVALPWAGGKYSVADYDVHRHSGVSFHIPLHRLLTRLLVAASHVWRAPLPAFFHASTKQDLVGYALTLLEAPLRIQVLTSQVNSGAWVRNGYSLLQASSVYTTQVELEGMMNADIAALQVVASLLHHAASEAGDVADVLIPALLHRFVLTRYFDWATHQAEGRGGEAADGLEPKHKQALAEDFLRLVINVINDRTVVGPPLPPASRTDWREEHHRLHMQDLIVRTVVHSLASGPKTHSQVVKAVGERMLKHRHGYFPHVRIQSLLDQTMAQTADFTPPSGPSHPTGTYTLKAGCLPLFDPYYPHYGRQEQQAALEFYHVTVKKLRPNHVSGVALPNLRGVPEVIREGVASIAHSPTLMAVLFSILHHIRAARLHPDAAHASPLGDIALLHPTLTLLKLALQFHASFPASSSSSPSTASVGAEEADPRVESVASVFDLRFRSMDPATNMCQEFEIHTKEQQQHQRESVLMLLLQLRAQEGEDMAEYREALTEVVGLVEAQGGPAVRAALSQLTALLDEERRSKEEALRKEALRKRRMEENKARQQAILARFAAKQQAFMDTVKQEGPDDAAAAEEDIAVPSATAGPPIVPEQQAAGDHQQEEEETSTSSDLVCVLCKEGAQAGKGLGYVALVQHSHVLPVAKRQNLGKLYMPQHRRLASFFSPTPTPTTTKDKGKDKMEEEEGRKEDKDKETTPQEGQGAKTSGEDAGDAGTAMEHAPAEGTRSEEDDVEARRLKAVQEQRARAQRWRAELGREVEGTGGAYVNSCGHLMHSECRHQYGLSVARDAALGRLSADPMLTPSALAQGAFRCPLCRSLGNALIPLLPPGVSPLPACSPEGLAHDAAAWEDWVARSTVLLPATTRPDDAHAEEEEEEGTHQLPDVTQEEQEGIRSVLHDFATRVYCAQHNVGVEMVDVLPHELEPHLWSLAACMAASLELANRPDAALGTEGGWGALLKVAEERRGANLRTVCRALLAYGRLLHDSRRLVRTDRLLRRSLAPPGDRSKEEEVGERRDEDKTEEERKSPFLSTDLFAHFVRRYFLDLLLSRPSPDAGGEPQQQQQQQQHVGCLRWARLLYIATYVQAVVSLAATYLTTAGHEQEEEGEEAEKEKELGGGAQAGESVGMEDKAALAALLDLLGRVSGGRLRLPHHQWTARQWDRWAGELVHLLLPFVRRVAMFLHVCGGLPVPSLESPFTPRQELETLLGCLAIPRAFVPATDSDEGASTTWKLVQQWLEQLLEDSSPINMDSLLLATPDLPFHFDKRALPFLFQDLIFFRAPAEAICPTCGQVPRQPGLCLLCSRLVCVGSTCCAPDNKPGECNTHALSCAGGEGVYLLARQTITLLLQVPAEHGCLMGSLYLDEHKEEDVGLKRGRPLYLDPSRYEQLRTLWLDHQMAPSITRRAAGQNVNWPQL